MICALGWNNHTASNASLKFPKNGGRHRSERRVFLASESCAPGLAERAHTFAACPKDCVDSS